MTFKEIQKAIARNLGLLASDNETIIEGAITTNGIRDEINRVYKNIVLPRLIATSPDDFAVIAEQNTNRASFTVASVDTVNKLLVSTTGVFGNADVGFEIYNPTKNKTIKITGYVNPTQIGYESNPASDWTGDVVYILSNILVLDGDLEDFKEVLKLDIKYNPSVNRWKNSQQLTIANFIDNIDNTYNGTNTGTCYFCTTSIKINDVTKKVIKYYPYPSNYNGTIRLTYSQIPASLVQTDDVPMLDSLGVSEIIINGVTSWGWKMLNDLNKASLYEENNPQMGGIVPKGLTLAIQSYKPFRSSKIKYSGFRSFR
jgi:hypothetical protein